MPPSDAIPETLLGNHKYAIFRLIQGEGGLWFWGMDADEVNGSKNTLKVYGARELLAVAEDSELIAFSTEDNEVILTAISTISRYTSYKEFLAIPNQNDYLYKAAIAPNNHLMALGSQFGTISIWAGR